CYFFSSRRRHTRFSRDWSSDVCSSDLELDIFFLINALSSGFAILLAEFLTLSGKFSVDRPEAFGFLRSKAKPFGDVGGAGSVNKIGRASCRGRVRSRCTSVCGSEQGEE